MSEGANVRKLEDVRREAIEAYAREFDAKIAHYVERTCESGAASDAAVLDLARLEAEAKRIVAVVALAAKGST